MDAFGVGMQGETTLWISSTNKFINLKENMTNYETDVWKYYDRLLSSVIKINLCLPNRN